jgi:hypothetical protein
LRDKVGHQHFRGITLHGGAAYVQTETNYSLLPATHGLPAYRLQPMAYTITVRFVTVLGNTPLHRNAMATAMPHALALMAHQLLASQPEDACSSLGSGEQQHKHGAPRRVV